MNTKTVPILHSTYTFTLRVLIASFCISFLGCSYNFSDDNYINLEEPNIDGVSIVLNSFNNRDTINVDKLLSYTINTQPNQYGIATEILLDNKRIASSSNSSSGEFTVRPSLYDDGEHTIRIVHVMSSGTGSIAEQQQLETITAFKDFQFTINRKPSPPPTITNARIENGSILLEWQNNDNTEFISAYISLQFPDYEMRMPISREILELGSFIDTYTVLFPLDSNRPEREDRSMVTYAIVFVSEYEEIYGEGATLEHDPSWIAVTMSFVDLEQYSVTWPKHPLYANFDSYLVSIRTDWSTEAYTFSASTQGGSELVDTPYSFGADYFGTLFPETDYDPYIPSYNFKPILDENSFKQIQNIDEYFGMDFIYNPSTQRYYLLAMENNAVGSNRGITIFEYSMDFDLIKKTVLFDQGSLREVRAIKFELDPNSNNFYLDIIYRGEDFQLVYQTMELDKNNLGILRKYSAENITSFQLRGNILKMWDYQTRTLTLTNVDTNTTFYTYTNLSSNATSISYLSNNGKYIYIRQDVDYDIYQIENNNVTKSVDLVDPAYSTNSMSIHEDQLYYATTGNSVKVIDLVTTQTTATLNYEAGNNNRSVAYDSFSNKILLTQAEVCYMFDLNSGASSRFSYESDKGNIGPGDDYFLWLTNGKLIHSKGIYVDIE